MFATTFAYQSATSNYILSVDQTKTTQTARWLQSQGVKRFRVQTKNRVASFLVYATNMKTAIAQRLNKKFNPPAPAPTPAPAKTLAPTVFRLQPDETYELLVDNQSAIATTAWLESKGCTFDCYITDGITRYVFITIPATVSAAIAKKYGCILMPEPRVEEVVAPTPKMARPGVKGVALSQSFLRIAFSMENEKSNFWNRVYRNPELVRKLYAGITDLEWKIFLALVYDHEDMTDYKKDIAAIKAGDINAGEIIFGDVSAFAKYARKNYPAPSRGLTQAA